MLEDNWPHKWFGFWSDKDGKPEEFPNVEEFVDFTWDPVVRSRVLRYLKEATCVMAVGMPVRVCEKCQQKVLSVSFRSDGVWLWPDGLAHLVEVHGVRIPSGFEQHMIISDFEPSKDFPSAIVMSLDWPKINHPK